MPIATPSSVESTRETANKTFVPFLGLYHVFEVRQIGLRYHKEVKSRKFYGLTVVNALDNMEDFGADSHLIFGDIFPKDESSFLRFYQLLRVIDTVSAYQYNDLDDSKG